MKTQPKNEKSNNEMTDLEKSMNDNTRADAAKGEEMRADAAQKAASSESAATPLAVLPESNPPTAAGVSAVDYSQYEGAGLDDIHKEDIQIPIFALVQDKAKYTKEKSEKYIPGCVPGMIVDTTSRRAFPGDEGIYVTICKMDMQYVEWISRDDGGGFIAMHPDTSNILHRCKKDEKGHWVIQSGEGQGHEIVDTYYYYCLRLDKKLPEGFEPIVVTMARSQMKIARQLNFKIMNTRVQCGARAIKAPLWVPVWHLMTKEDANSKGDEFYNWAFEQYGTIIDLGPARETILHQAGESYRKTIESGVARIADPDETDDLEPGADAEEAEWNDAASSAEQPAVMSGASIPF